MVLGKMACARGSSFVSAAGGGNSSNTELALSVFEPAH